MKDKFAFSDTYKSPTPKRRQLRAKRHFHKQKGPCFKRPLNWTGSILPLLKVGNGNQLHDWVAAHGAVTHGGLSCVWPPFLDFGRNRPFSPLSCLFSPFSGGPKHLQISPALPKPPPLKTPSAALRNNSEIVYVGRQFFWQRTQKIF